MDINHNFGYPLELVTLADDGFEVIGVCHKRPGEGASVSGFKLYLEFEGSWYAIKEVPDQVRHKYEELLITKWLEQKR